MSQPTLFHRHNPPAFSGETYDETHDAVRLTGQLRRVWHVVKDHQWRTLAEIRNLADAPEASVSARLRQLRSLGYLVQARRRGDPKNGCWEYRCEAP